MDFRVQLPPALYAVYSDASGVICGFVKTLYKNESKPDFVGGEALKLAEDNNVMLRNRKDLVGTPREDTS